MKSLLACLSLFVGILMSSCTQYNFDDMDEGFEAEEGRVEVIFHITDIEQIPFENTYVSRASQLSALCSRITLAVFQGEEKIKNVSQLVGSDAFGTFTMELKPGNYRLVVIAHNGTGNATISTPERITFPNNKCTDTFYNYQEFDVEQDASVSVSLKRAVAAFRMSITDNMPLNVSKMQFYYTGGSSTFDAVSGYGCVNSKQTETFAIGEEMKGAPTQFQVYTFPHAQSGSLKMTVTAMDASGTSICEKVYENLPITVNKISCWEGEFFQSANIECSSAFTLDVDNGGEWGGTISVE